MLEIFKQSTMLLKVEMDYVIHAAAMKQVPACEKFPIEAIKTNVDGSRNVMFVVLKKQSPTASSSVIKIYSIRVDHCQRPLFSFG